MNALAATSLVHEAGSGGASSPPPGEITVRDQGLTIDEAAELTGESARTWRRRAELWVTANPPLAWIGPNPHGGKQCYWIARRADSRLAERMPPDGGLPPEFGRLPEHVQQRAQQRVAWLRRWWSICKTVGDAAEAGRILIEAIRRDDPQAKVSLRTLNRWDLAYRQGGLLALAGGYAYCVGTPFDPKEGLPEGRSEDAQLFFLDLYLTQQRRSVALCHRLTLHEARKHDWPWPQSYSSARMYAKSIADPIADLARRGWTYYYRHHLQYSEFDYSTVRPGERFVADSHKLKAFVRWWDGSVLRPVLVGNIDLASRLVVGWAFCKENNEQTNLGVLRKSFCDWAIPDVQKCDNGKDYDARTIQGITKQERFRKQLLEREADKYEATERAWKGVLPELGVRVSHAKPFNPRAKIIERFFGRVSSQFTVNLPTFCGTSPETKPEDLKHILKDPANVPHIADIINQFRQWIDIYHTTPHQGDGMLGSPLATWNAKAESLRKADPEALAMLCQVRHSGSPDGTGLYRVGANGVRLKIGSATFGYGRDEPGLFGWKGRKVLVGADESDMRTVFIFTPDRKKRQLICIARMNERISANEPVSSEDLREANRRVERAKLHAKRGRQSAVNAIMGSTHMAMQVLADQRKAVQAEKRRQAAGAEGVAIVPVETGFEGAAKAALNERARMTNRQAVARESCELTLDDLDLSKPEPEGLTAAEGWELLEDDSEPRSLEPETEAASEKHGDVFGRIGEFVRREGGDGDAA